MKTYAYSFLIAIMASFVFSSCLGDKEEVVYSDYCNITKFSLSTLRKENHVTGSRGQDSIFYTSYSGVYYPMTIDQKKLTIENVDSLPYHTLTNRVLTACTFEGILLHRLKDISALEPSDTMWTTYDAKDTLDFTSPREFLVVAADGISLRRYTVKVNVHKVNPDETVWDELGVSTTPDLDVKTRKLSVLNGHVVLMGQKEDGTLVCYTREAQKTGEWQEQTLTGVEGALLETMQLKDETLYMSTQTGAVIYSIDGKEWRNRFVGKPGLRVTGVTEGCCYGIADGQLLCTTLAQEDWISEKLDDEATLLPQLDITTVCLLQKNGGKRLLMTGKTSDGTQARLWAKTWTGKVGDEKAATWVYYPDNAAIKKTFPLLNQENVFAYGDGVMALGGKPVQGEGEALSQLYYSYDNGVTWVNHETMILDSRLKEAAQQAKFITACSADGKFIWLMLDNQLWRARLNSVAFDM